MRNVERKIKIENKIRFAATSATQKHVFPVPQDFEWVAVHKICCYLLLPQLLHECTPRGGAYLYGF